VDDPLILVRAVHFAATLTAAGAAFFVVFIAEPVLGPLGAGAPLRRVTSRRLAWLVRIGVALTLLSGAAWFVLLAQSISNEPLAEVFSQDTLWTLLVDTGFGRAWMVRLLLVVCSRARSPFGQRGSKTERAG
jgi:putative copper resistance protein D